MEKWIKDEIVKEEQQKIEIEEKSRKSLIFF
jgi:hypothetical protein